MTWPIRKQSQWQGQGQIHFMNREPEFAKITVNFQLRVRVTLGSIRSSCDVLSWFRLIMVSLIIIWCYSPITPFSGPSQRSWPSLFTFGGCLSSFKFLISFFTLIDLYTIYIYSASLILIGGTIENIHLNFPNSEGGGQPNLEDFQKMEYHCQNHYFSPYTARHPCLWRCQPTLS